MTDQPPTGGDRTTDLEARIADLERRSAGGSGSDDGRRGMETAFWAMVHNLFPEEARKHLKAATREQLLAARVYVDRWIEQLDEQDADRAAGRTHEKIEVE